MRLAAGFAVVAALACGGGAPPVERPPNVIVILADDLGYNDISLHGNRLWSTPNIDRIGREGVRFNRGHTTHATCSPSRAALMTGRYQQRFGYEFTVGANNLVPGFDGTLGPRDPRTVITPEANDPVRLEIQGVPPEEITLAELVGPAYRSAMLGKWHLGVGPRFSPSSQGFDEWIGFGAALYGAVDDPEVIAARLPWDGIDNVLWSRLRTTVQRNGEDVEPGKYLTDFLTDEAVRFIDESGDEPFLLYLSYFAPHTPLQAPKDVYDRLDHIGVERQRVYAAMIESMDEGVGRVLDKLDEEGLAENTLVFFTSDNGGAPYVNIPHLNDPFRGWKGTFYQGGVVVPYLLRWPERVPAGLVREAPVSTLDVFPTVAEATGAQPPGDRAYDGESLLPLVDDPSAHGERALLWRAGDYKAVQKGDWKLHIDGTQGKRWLSHLAEDPGEHGDLSGAHPERLDELLGFLEEMEASFVEPLWPTPFYVPFVIDKDEDGTPVGDDYVLFPG